MTGAGTGKRRRARHVLVADDDDAMRTLLVSALTPLGFEVLAVKDGGELAELACRPEGPPSLVVTDLQMPNVSGAAAIRRIRKAGLTMPIILVTAFGSDSLHSDALRNGATAVLDKPFPIVALQDLARQLLGGAPGLGQSGIVTSRQEDDETEDSEREVG